MYIIMIIIIDIDIRFKHLQHYINIRIIIPYISML